jgi:SAM-dependent methyltransferase
MLPPSAPLEILRCPATGSALIANGTDALLTPDSKRRYPVLPSGVPVLICDEKSAFSVADYTGQRPGARQQARARLRAAVKRLLPTTSRNVGSADNYRLLRDRLLERVSGTSAARLLVVGGAISGVGFEAIANSEQIETLDTDVAIGPRTKVICDAHDLPFQDGVFDAVVCQAVLEHVLDPTRVVSEIHRVLKPDGLVYSEIPFMQQVHGGAHDVTRFTLLGHRRLFRDFDEIKTGAQGGPGMALGWSVQYFAMSFARSKVIRRSLWLVATLGTFWLKYFDDFLVRRRPAALDAASGTYFLGRRSETPVLDEEILRGYRGGGPKEIDLE